MSEEKSNEVVFQVLRLKQVQERLGLGRSTIYDRLNFKSARYDSTFPKPIKLGMAAVGWIEAEINAWVYSRVAAAAHGTLEVRVVCGREVEGKNIDGKPYEGLARQ